MRHKILIVDDEEMILAMLKDHFETENYIVYTCSGGREALKKLSCEPDIILLDINMPEIDGLELCSRIRDHVICPILFLTARVTEQDKIDGFRSGGDDYIVKPFSIDELTARVEAHLRRDLRSQTRIISKFSRDITIDYSGHQVLFKDDPISLAKKEFEIVKLLSMNTGHVFDRETIYAKIWGFNNSGDSSVVKEHIRRIRTKLFEYTDEEYIETVWGVGYKWVK